MDSKLKVAVDNEKQKPEREMYNEDQKREYAKLSVKNEDGLIRYFQRICNMEKHFDKDIADMNESELKDTLMSLNIRREESRAHLISLMRGYINWAQLYNKTDNNSMINSINAESLGSKDVILSQMVGSPEQLEDILDKAMLKDAKGHYLMPNRAVRDQLVFWLAYSGMNLNEMITLEKTNIDIQKKVVITKEGKEYHVSHKIISLWKECCNATYVERKNGKATGKGSQAGEIIKSDLVDNNYLFRTIRGHNEDENRIFKAGTLSNIIIKTFQSYNKNTNQNIKFSPEKIRYSGIFYRLFKREISGEKITPEIIAESFDIEYNNDDKTKLLTNTRKWRIDYEDWKLAFGYINQLV